MHARAHTHYSTTSGTGGLNNTGLPHIIVRENAVLHGE